MFGKPEIEYVYSLWDGKLERSVVESYNPETERIEGRNHRGGRFISDLSCGMYFRTPEEAAKEEWDNNKSCLEEARQEVLDALATYKEVRKLARTPFEEFFKSLPRSF